MSRHRRLLRRHVVKRFWTPDSSAAEGGKAPTPRCVILKYIMYIMYMYIMYIFGIVVNCWKAHTTLRGPRIKAARVQAGAPPRRVRRGGASSFRQ